MMRRRRRSPLFPYPTLFRSAVDQPHRHAQRAQQVGHRRREVLAVAGMAREEEVLLGIDVRRRLARRQRVPEAVTQIALDRRSEEHTSELQSQSNLVCRLLL